MPRYRTRPVEPEIIEARQFVPPPPPRSPESWARVAEALAEWCEGDWTPPFLPGYGPVVGSRTPEGYKDCQPGQWIVRYRGGTFGVLSDFDFQRIYEPIPEEG